VWSQENCDFFGRDEADALVGLPWRGWTNALVRARIPYLPVHADHIARDADRFSVLILPNFAAMTAAQVDAVRNFVKRGGGLVATGQASRCNEFGEPQSDFALADLFGAHVTGNSGDFASLHRTSETQQTYLRLMPELRAQVYGPQTAAAPAANGKRHPALKGFDDTDLLAFGGTLEPLRIDGGATILATFVPAFPSFPPEEVFMRQPRTDNPGLIVNESGAHGRVAFLPADLDTRYGRDNLPDHGNLLSNLVNWAAGENVPLQIEGAGLVDCHLYRQQNHLVLHLVNLTNAGTWRAPVDELISIGPLSVCVQLPSGVHGRQVRLLVSQAPAKAAVKNGWLHFNLPKILDHEVAVIG
jgi:hypothetical protein